MTCNQIVQTEIELFSQVESPPFSQRVFSLFSL